MSIRNRMHKLWFEMVTHSKDVLSLSSTDHSFYLQRNQCEGKEQQLQLLSDILAGLCLLHSNSEVEITAFALTGSYFSRLIHLRVLL